MKIVKGILVVLVTIALFWASQARSGTMDELSQLLSSVPKVYPMGDGIGSCWFDKDNKLTFKKEDMRVSKSCIVGMKLPDTTKHYILIRDKAGPKELLLFDEKDKTQKVLWRSGVEV